MLDMMMQDMMMQDMMHLWCMLFITSVILYQRLFGAIQDKHCDHFDVNMINETHKNT